MSGSEIHLLLPLLHPSTFIISLPRTSSSIHPSSLCTHFFIHPFFHPSIHQHRVPNLLPCTSSSIPHYLTPSHFFIHPSVIIMYPLLHPSFFHPSIPGSVVRKVGRENQAGPRHRAQVAKISLGRENRPGPGMDNFTK
jgi:hypothetical protein